MIDKTPTIIMYFCILALGAVGMAIVAQAVKAGAGS